MSPVTRTSVTRGGYQSRALGLGPLLPGASRTAGWSRETGGAGGGVDGELGEAPVFFAPDQGEVMVGVNLDDVRAQCLGQFPLLGRAHQLIAGRDEHGRGEIQLTRPRLRVISAQRASRVRELACEPAAELRGQPGTVGIEFGRLLDGLA